jgi:hypothetical protein
VQVEQVRERFAQGWSQHAGCEDAGSRFWCCRIVSVVAGVVVDIGVCDGGVVDDRADIMSSRDVRERAHESREESLALDVVVF